jgi:hypothetical protein
MMRVAGITVLAVSLIGLCTWAMTAADPPAPTPVAVSTNVAACKTCHSGADQIGVRDFVKKFQSEKFIRLNESITWEEKDPHSKAFEVLKSETGKRMAEKLKYDVTTDARCLACHATHRGTPKGPAFDVSNGVGCSGCHGTQADWQTMHYDSTTGTEIDWRSVSPAEKEAKYGLNDLRDPVVKAKKCASCHIGNPAENKVITHEIYAAGHPPLPPFELMTFLDDEPRHWDFASKIPYFSKLDPAKAKSLFHVFGADDQPRLRHVLAGALASLAAEARLIRFDAEEAIRHNNTVDYARFDCYACHHDLKLPSDRQKRGYPGAPGRPPLKAWNGALALIAAIDRGEEKPFRAAWHDAQMAAFAKPYGDAEAMAKTAKVLENWAETAMKKLSEPMTAERRDRLSTAILKLLSEEVTLADPEAAMALVWSYRALTEFDAAAWAKVQAILPVGPMDTADRSGNTPITAGMVLPARLDRFNKFTADVFLKTPLPQSSNPNR